MKRKITSSVLVVFLLICITTAVIISYAYFTSEELVTNTVKIGDVNIEINETFTPPENWDGSEAYPKIVTILNKSKSEALIRVSIIPRWVDENDHAWPGDTNIVNLNYSTNNIINTPSITPENKWIDGNDGYYYYNSIVPKNNYTEEILDSVKIDVPVDLKERYKGKTLIVDVKAEAVQATTDAHREVWSNIIEGSQIQNMLDSLCTR